MQLARHESGAGWQPARRLATAAVSCKRGGWPIAQSAAHYRAIAYAMGISEGTVKTYLYRLFRKLGMNDRLDFGALWIEKPVRRPTRTGEVEGRRSAGTGGGQASCAVLGFNAGTQASRSSSGALSEVRAGPGHSLKPIPGDDCEQF